MKAPQVPFTFNSVAYSACPPLFLATHLKSPLCLSLILSMLKLLNRGDTFEILIPDATSMGFSLSHHEISIGKSPFMAMH